MSERAARPAQPAGASLRATVLLQQLALGLLLALLPLLPVLAGKTFPWQAELVALIVAVAALLWLGGQWRRGAGEASPPGPLSQGERGGERRRTGERGGGEASPPGPLSQGERGGERQQAAERGGGVDAIDLALALFVLLQLLSWFPSVYRFASAVYGAKVLSYALVFWLLRYGLKDRTWWRVALWCLLSGGMLLSVLGLQEYVRTVKFLGATDWRVFGSMFNPNIAAGYLLLTIFPAFALLLGWQSRGRDDGTATATVAPRGGALRARTPKGEAGSRASRRSRAPESASAAADGQPVPRYAEIAALFCGALIFVTILLTGSKGALISLLGAAVAFAWVGFRGRRMRLAIAGFVALTVLLAFVLPPLRARLLSAFDWQSHSTIFRGYTWQAALHMVAARPLTGFGGGTFENILPRYAVAGFTRAAHQSFLQIAAECGVPALLAGLTFGALLLGALYRRAHESAEALPRLVAAAALAGLLASAVQQLADYAWYVPAVGVAFFALAALALAPCRTSGALPALPAPRRRAALLAGAALVLVLLAWSVRAQYAAVLGLRAEAEIAAHDYSSAALTLQRAAAANPAEAQFYVQLAKVQEALGAEDRAALAAAIAARRAAIRLQPTEPVNYLALARLQEGSGDLKGALQTAQQALAWYPTYPRGLAQVLRLQERLGDHAAALATARRLDEVYRSPVGQYPPVTDLTETAYAQGWLALGDEAGRHGQDTAALAQYRQAADVLSRAITSERNYSAQMAAAGEGSWGHLDENTELAGQVLQRLQGVDRPVAVKLMVHLQQALGDTAEAERLLRYQLRQPVRGASGPLAKAWAGLQLAKMLPDEKQEEAQGLAKKSGEEGRAALAAADTRAASAEGWLPADTQALRDLLPR